MVMVTLPAIRRLTTGELQAAVRVPRVTGSGFVESTSTMAWSNVMLTATASRSATVPMFTSTLVVCPTLAITALDGSATETAWALDAAPARKARIATI